MNNANDESDASTNGTTALERDIAKTRGSLSQTLGELHGKLNPEALKVQALDQFNQAKAVITADLKDAKESIKADLRTEIQEIKRGLRSELTSVKDEIREATVGRVEHMVQNTRDTVNQTSKSILETLSDNPIPTAIVGIGLGWLFLNARAKRRASQSPSYGVKGYENGRSFAQGGERYDRSYGGPVRTTGGRVEEYAQQAAHTAGDVAKNVASNAKNAAKQAVKDVSDQAGSALHSLDEATHGARENIAHLAHDARDTVGNVAHRFEGGFERTLRENPLPAGAVALAIGLAVGLSIPSTKVEDEWMGEARDNALEGAQTYADQAIGQLESAATKLVQGDENNDAKPAGSSEQVSRSS
jgi:gas vesicle protein